MDGIAKKCIPLLAGMLLFSSYAQAEEAGTDSSDGLNIVTKQVARTSANPFKYSVEEPFDEKLERTGAFPPEIIQMLKEWHEEKRAEQARCPDGPEQCEDQTLEELLGGGILNAVPVWEQQRIKKLSDSMMGAEVELSTLEYRGFINDKHMFVNTETNVISTLTDEQFNYINQVNMTVPMEEGKK